MIKTFNHNNLNNPDHPDQYNHQYKQICITVRIIKNISENSIVNINIQIKSY